MRADYCPFANEPCQAMCLGDCRLREHSSHTSALLRQELAEVKALHTAIRKLHAAKGRYHTQLAACDLFDLVGLPNERPKK